MDQTTNRGKVITRFAPSPTGNLHIGSARTALFNYLYARANNGKFLLRIDDTDLARSKDEYTHNITASLEFLGINWDNKGHELHQSSRMNVYKQIAYELVEKGFAYKCYVPVEDANLGMIEDPNQRKDYMRSYPSGDEFSVRFKMPTEGSFRMHDTISQGTEIKYESMDDFTLLRKDGTATYMLSSVVDDEELKITNIIRGTEHLSNTYRQIPLIHALGYSLPIYTHIPLINNPDGKKLSKRLDATSVQEYADMGILPEALCNYVLRLGWGHENVDIISMEEVIKIFNLNDLRPSPARFDMDKLLSMNSHYMRKLTAEEVLERIFVNKKVSQEFRNRVKICIPNMLEKANTLKYIEDMSEKILLNESVSIEDELPAISGESRSILENLPFNEFNYETVEETKNSLTSYIQHGNKKEIMMFLRVAMTGMRVSPGLFEIINAIGPEIAKKRLDKALNS